MADRIKGITIQIGGDTTGLSKALSNTNKEINSTKSQLKDVEKLLKLDPKNTELLEQKQKLLGDAIGKTKEKLSALKDAEKQAQEQFQRGEISEQQYMSLKREIEATEIELKDLESQAKNTTDSMEKIGTTAEKVAKGADKVASATKGLSTAAAGGVAALSAMAIKSARAADDLNTLAKQSGFSTDEIQKWQYASDLVDVSVNDIVASAKKLKSNMASSSKSVTSTFKKLGVAVKDNNGKFRDSTDVFYDTIAALGKIEDGTERDLIAMKLFGKGADNLAGIIDDGGKALRELGEEAENAGLIMSSDTLDAANEFNDAMDKLKAETQGQFMKIGAELATTLLPYLQELADMLSNVMNWFSKLDETQQKWIVGVLLAVASISPLAKAIGSLSTIMSFLGTKVIPMVGNALSFLAANPIVLIIGAIVAVVAAIAMFGDEIQEVLGNVDDFMQNIFSKDFSEQFGFLGTILNGFLDVVKTIWDTIVGIFNGVIDFIRGVFTGNWKRAWNGVKNIFGSIFGGLAELVKKPFNFIIGMLNKVVDGLNWLIGGLNKISFDVPDWIPFIGGKTWGINIPDIPSIPYLAKGGVLKSGSAVVGEAGAEILTMTNSGAVVQPLSGSGASTSGLTDILSALNQYLPYLAEGNQIVLDTGALVGATAPAMNREFGRMANREAYR